MARKKQFAALALMGSMVLSSSGLLSAPAVFADSFAKDNVLKEEEKIDSATPDVDPNATIAIDSTNFPDANFRDYVKKFDTNNNGSLTDAERSAVKTINVNDLGITKLKGIEYFTSITTLKCAGNKLSYYTTGSFDISKNTALTVLDISRNSDLTRVDLSNNKKLQTLDISLCEMSKIDLSANTALQSLVAKRTGLNSIDLSNHKSLTSVTLSENFYLNTFDFSNCTALKTIRANNNSYYYGTNGNMYLDGCKNLEELYLSFGHVKEVDVKDCPKLRILDCSLIGLSELNLTKNVNLTKLICSNNKLSELNLTKNTKLTYLDCSENYIDALNLTKNTALTELYCQVNYLTALNVSKNTNLKFLNCSVNGLSTLNVTNNANLVYLSCYDNELSNLNVTKNAKLEILSCYSNDIAKLNITKNRSVALAVKQAKRQDAGSYYFHQMDGNGVYGIYGLYYDKDTVIVTPSKLPTPTKKPVTNTPTPTKKVTKTPSKAPTKAPQFSDFVERLYTCALNRKSDPEGKKYWTNEVQSGKRTGADCARYFLLDAPEFMNRKLSVENFVETLYKTFFDRKSDAAGKEGWVKAIKSGKKTRAEVVNDFIESTEWCNICAKYSVKSGAKYHKATIASPKSKEFATRLYTSCLKRKADADGVKYWSLALTNLEQTGCSAAKFFFTGEEFKNLKTTPEEYVRRLYTTFMGRKASADEVKYWANQIKSGAKTRLAVLKFFGSSEEFTKICAKYGIDRGTI